VTTRLLNPVARKINREAVVVLGWGRAILLQLAHPLVAQGVADHSDFSSGALGYAQRARHTISAMLSLTFGTDAEAQTTADRINTIHDRTHGTLKDPAGVFPAGTRYSARDPQLLAWVHATLLDSLPLAYERFVGPLTIAEKDRYCEEATSVGPLLHIPHELLPKSDRELRRYLDAMYRSGEIHVTPTARDVAGQLLTPVAWPAAHLLAPGRLATIGLLPPPIREAYGFTWDASDERAFKRLTTMVRKARGLLPAALREWPAARRTPSEAPGP
jgi:uncharacterized protein (DUF2236 family)